MIISKKLQVITEGEILDEVAKELGLKRSDVQRTFDIWLKHLKHMSENTPICNIILGSLGRMFVSTHRMRRMFSKKEKAYKDLKMSEINKLDNYCQYNVHKTSKPIILKYGISKRNHIPYLKDNSVKQLNYYTLSELVNKQTEAFFREDFEFRNSSNELKNHFLREPDDEIHLIEEKYRKELYREYYENRENYKSKIKRQKQNKRRMVFRTIRHLRKV